jgi:hypothetical protein
MQTKGGNGTCLGGGDGGELGTSRSYHITSLGGMRERGGLERVGKGQKRQEGYII